MRHYIKRLLICIAIRTANTATWATDYVITYTVNGTIHFLSCSVSNSQGSIADATEFNPTTCIWTYDSKKHLSNNNYYILCSNSALSLQNSSSNSSECTISEDQLTCKGKIKTYYLYYNTKSSKWAASSSNQSNSPSSYSVSTATVPAQGLPTALNLTSSDNNFTTVGGTRTYSVLNFSYTPPLQDLHLEQQNPILCFD